MGFSRRIFYSWQSDLDSTLARSFIEGALSEAASRISNDDSLNIEAVVDRDTAGVGGSPAVVDTLLSKIATCEFFVVDVTITNSHTAARPAPNPNVLVELGYAVSSVGWERILMVQNVAFGQPERLPFDLRHRRVIRYELSHGHSSEEYETAKEYLVAEMQTALREHFLTVYGTMRLPPTSRRMWWGFWERPMEYHGQSWSAYLFVREVNWEGFLFQLIVTHGTHSGEVSGFARFVGPDAALARLETQRGGCELSFKRTSLGDVREIVITEEGDCQYFRGAGAYFSCRVVRMKEAVFESGDLDELDLARLYGITGEFYRPIVGHLQMIGKGKNEDRFRAEVIEGGVRGAFGGIGVIIMRGLEGQLWAAYADGSQVRYFTTEPEFRSVLPMTIELWRQPYKDQPLLMCPPVKTIPYQYPQNKGLP